MEIQENRKNILVPVDREGKITPEDLKLIKDNLINQLAKDSFSKALKYANIHIPSVDIFLLEYGGLNLFMVHADRTESLKQHIENQYNIILIHSKAY